MGSARGSSDPCPSPACLARGTNFPSPEHQPHQQPGQASRNHRSGDSVMAFWKGWSPPSRDEALGKLGCQEHSTEMQ